MHRIPGVAAMVFSLLFGSAVPAAAQWRWLEKMSGPGWYDGVSLEFKLLCWYPPAEAAGAAVPETTLSLPCVRPFVAGDATANKSRHRIFTLGVSGGVLWSTVNRLQYSEELRQRAEDTQVWVVAPGIYADVRIPLPRPDRIWLDNLELGGTAEAFRMDSKVMQSLWRWATEARLTLNLVTIRNAAADNNIAHVKVRAGALWLHGSLDASDFGALPGRLSSKQVHTSVRILFDVECFPWKSKC